MSADGFMNSLALLHRDLGTPAQFHNRGEPLIFAVSIPYEIAPFITQFAKHRANTKLLHSKDVRGGARQKCQAMLVQEDAVVLGEQTRARSIAFSKHKEHIRTKLLSLCDVILPVQLDCGRDIAGFYPGARGRNQFLSICRANLHFDVLSVGFDGLGTHSQFFGDSAGA